MVRRRIAAPLLVAALLLFVVAGVVAGASVALLAGSDTTQTTHFATIDTRVVPARTGNITVFAPIVGWRVRLLEHRAPVHVELELRSLDRATATSGISSRTAARASLEQVRTDSRHVVRAAVRRAALVASFGGVLGGVLAGAVVAAASRRRRWLLIGSAVGVVLTAAIVSTSAVVLDGLDSSQVRARASGVDADELPRILQFGEQLLVVGDDYERLYARALDSVDNILEFTSATTRRPTAATATGAAHSAFLVSDIHDNVFVLGAFDAFADGEPVFAVGDFGQVGAHVEQATAPRIATLGGSVVAVSGNHDSESYMRSLAKAGATVLPDPGAAAGEPDAKPLDVDGLSVVGYPDPLATQEGDDGAHVLRVHGDAYQRQVDDFLAWYGELPSRPDVVLVHQHGFALRLAEQLAKEPHDAAASPLLILTGHDHKPHVDLPSSFDGAAVIVDGGTLGAGGPFAVGEQDVSFAHLHFRGTTLTAVDIVSIDPVSGRASSQRTPIG